MSDLRVTAVPVLHAEDRKAVADELRWLAEKMEAGAGVPTGVAVAITFADGGCGEFVSRPTVTMLGALALLRQNVERKLETP